MGGKFLGERLEEKRKDKGYKQKQLAQMIGVTESTISAYEQSRVTPKLANLIKMCDLLDISPDYLLGYTDEEIPASQKYYLPLSKEYPPEMKDDLLKHLHLLKLQYKQ